jgi:UDP-N-acetyl-D-mannosaminuronic acid dehydrogenase
MISVIGLGEIGLEVMKGLCKSRKDIFGVDIDEGKLKELKQKGYNVGNETPKSDVYIISVYLTEQVFGLLKKLDFSNNPIVVIESTIMPGTYKKIIQWKKSNKLNFDIVLFPHRYNPNDPEHHVFNLKRVMGGDKKSLDRAKEFYKDFMDIQLIHITTPEIAELCKPLENTYRFIEIALAQEIKRLCNQKNIDFESLRSACNTKWNIDIKEAREGIKGKCLPKDASLIDNFFKGNIFISSAKKLNEDYVKSCETVKK